MDATRTRGLLRVFTDEKARAGDRALYEAVVLTAREAGLAGVTVLRGVMGYGRSARLHNAHIIDLAADLPLVIEIVDDEAALRGFLRTLAEMKDIGLVTLERVEVLHTGAPAA